MLTKLTAKLFQMKQMSIKRFNWYQQSFLMNINIILYKLL